MASVGRLFEVLFAIYFIYRLGSLTLPVSDEDRAKLKDYLELKNAELRTLHHTKTLPPPSLAQLNLTNVVGYNGSKHFLPRELHKRVVRIWDDGHAGRANVSLYYSNISSYMHGEYEPLSSSLFKQPMELPLDNFDEGTHDSGEALREAQALAHGPGTAAISIIEGKRTLKHPQNHALARVIDCRIISSTHPVLIELEGVYLEHGHVLLSTSSLKFSGLEALPYLIPDPEKDPSAESARKLVLAALNHTLDRINVTESYEYVDQAYRRSRACEYVFFGHLNPARGISQSELDDIEQELLHPVGRPLPKLPPIEMTGVLWSPDCGVSFEVKGTGERSEYYVQRARRMLTLFFVNVLLVAMLSGSLARRHMSPSRACRLSFATIASFAAVDGIATVVALVQSSEPVYSMVLAAVSILLILQTYMFDIRLMGRVYSSQRTEDIADRRARDPDSTTPEPPAPELLSDQQVMMRIYQQYYTGILAFAVVTMVFMSIGDPAWKVYEAIVLMLLYSYWVPQIWRNARRGSPVPFSPAFCVSLTFLRLWPVLYLCFVKSNIGYHRYDPRLGWALLLWQIFQVAMLVGQSRYGSRFFLRGGFGSINVYNYHPLLTEDVESLNHATEVPLTVSDAPAVEERFDNDLQTQCRFVPCAICMSEVKLPIVQDEASANPAVLLERDNYMVTPCRHIFHTECLEQWLSSRLQCPVCRSPIPPI